MELRKALWTSAPIEFAAVNDDPSEGGSMATDPFGSRVYNNVDTVVYRPAKEACRCEGGVDLQLYQNTNWH